ncbi:hypothetical protein GLAREA_03931 [Glarea lozoyensis ATCC 20868]|uniref:Fungal N-terminal domain-containing protein n=1 Tax=Glarea lozoyensis (strain ATCC 20868 / MF5171) TaxID=1116229 RepID=S3D1C0_GLAL2|nr:uncharacterized protein GLAREA_03931 [Glarea lozoyensis ATCC 20868]EPE30964.1 hypothetical protein GLAREA_03931 [Glarea lozoyensis ATCC 20868]
MEAVAGVASIVGIVGFTGQAILGLLKLKTLISDAATAKDTINNVLEGYKTPTVLELGALKYQIVSCTIDVDKWVMAAQKIDPKSRKGFKAFLRKIKVATGKEDFQSLAQSISNHQQRIGIAVSILGRTLDILGIHSLNSVSKGLGGLTEAHLKLSNMINLGLNANSNSHPTEESIVGRLLSQLKSDTEASSEASRASLQSIQDSISSIASDVANLVSNSPTDEKGLFGTGTGASDISGSALLWSCDSVSGIEDAFVHHVCIYCSSSFQHILSWKDRGRHLVQFHGFGCCNLAIQFSTWAEMEAHITGFHDGNIIGDPVVRSKFLCPRRTAPRFQRTIEDTTEFVRTLEERSTAPLLLSAHFTTGMADLEILDKVLHMLDTCHSNGHQDYPILLVELKDLLLQGKFDSFVAPLWHIRYQMAPLVEDMIIQEIGMIRYHALASLPSRVRSRVGDILPVLLKAIEQSEFENHLLPFFVSVEWKTSVSERFDNNNRVNNWLLDVLKYSSNTRTFVANHLGLNIANISEMLTWLSSVVHSWLDDDIGIEDCEPHKLSDEALDSRDSILNPSLDRNTKPTKGYLETFDFQRGTRPSRDDSITSSLSGCSLKSEIAAKRNPGGRRQESIYGGSSMGSIDSIVAEHRPCKRARTEEYTPGSIYEQYYSLE